MGKVNTSIDPPVVSRSNRGKGVTTQGYLATQITDHKKMMNNRKYFALN